MYTFDIHTHSVASGHGSNDTILGMAVHAKEIGLTLLGVSDHGPQTPGSCGISYYRNISGAPPIRCGLPVLYGVELNILDREGTVDLDDCVLSRLDYAIAAMHVSNISPGTISENTAACIKAMENPFVRILGHPDDDKYPLDYPLILEAAMANHVLLELNDNSLSPNGYRGNTLPANIELLTLCRRYKYPVILGSDSHGKANIGSFGSAHKLLMEIGFPEKLVLNHSVSALLEFLKA